MTDFSYNITQKMSDKAILAQLGEYVRTERLQQNLSQTALAKAAGISRSTLSEFENDGRATTLTLIQLLRALKKLPLLQTFHHEEVMSPLMLAKRDKEKRKRASKGKSKPKTDW